MKCRGGRKGLKRMKCRRGGKGNWAKSHGNFGILAIENLGGNAQKSMFLGRGLSWAIKWGP
jgi:hypothetical protein